VKRNSGIASNRKNGERDNCSLRTTERTEQKMGKIKRPKIKRKEVGAARHAKNNWGRAGWKKPDAQRMLNKTGKKRRSHKKSKKGPGKKGN